ncbi:MAG TPA: thioredoxin domain-containing protein [Polyangiaceae bacterium]|nr:thioredoxin domain-containing protein [Polyangiaceae bacterium]
MLDSLQIPVSDRDHVRGVPGARLTLVEYGDFACPFCQAVYPVLKQLLERFTRDLKLVFRHNPRGELNPGSHVAAQAAEAAGLQGQFWAMHDRLFEQRRALDERVVLQLAEQLELDVQVFKGDLHSGPVALRVREDEIGGLRSGVIGTPTLFVDGRHFRDKPDLITLSQTVDSTLRSLRAS